MGTNTAALWVLLYSAGASIANPVYRAPMPSVRIAALANGFGIAALGENQHIVARLHRVDGHAEGFDQRARVVAVYGDGVQAVERP